MEGESRELSDTGVVRQRVGRDGAQGQGLAPGVGAGGDAGVDGGAEEWLEAVSGFEVGGEGLVVPEQQSLFLEGAGDADGDGAEQALEFGVRWCPDAIVPTRSSPMEQQTHPFANVTVSPSCAATRSPSTPIAPKSLTSTA